VIITFGDRLRLLGVKPSELHERWDSGRWLTDALLATPEAVERLDAWVKHGRPLHDPTRLRYAGDRAVSDALRGVLAKVPPPVAWWMVERAIFLGLGRDASGLCVHPSLPTEPGLRVVLIDGRADDAATVCAHEGAHLWCEPVSDPAGWYLDARCLNQAAFARVAVAFGRLDDAADLAERPERRAARLAREWGFTGAGADLAHCVRGARQRLLDRAKGTNLS
jgi:hypothetical protein